MVRALSHACMNPRPVTARLQYRKDALSSVGYYAFFVPQKEPLPLDSRQSFAGMGEVGEQALQCMNAWTYNAFGKTVVGVIYRWYWLSVRFEH